MSRNDAAVVLMYHRVSDAARDPFWLCASPENFEQHLEAMTEVAEVVRLASIFGRGRSLAITFDDGYRDNLDVAYPLLAKAGLPATVFVSSDVMSSTAAFWWDRLERMVLGSHSPHASLDVDVRSDRIRLDLGDADQRQRSLAELQSHLRRVPVTEIDSVLIALEARLADADVDVADTDVEDPPLLDEQGVRALARDGLVEIGGHARSHSMLSILSRTEQWSEIVGGKEALERVIEKPVTSFAYPFGDRHAFTSRSVALVKRAGFELACTTRSGRVTRSTRRFRVPRLAVRNWDRERFVREVRRALDGDS